MKPNIRPVPAVAALLAIWSASLLLIQACATLQSGADPLVVRTEQVQAGADATIDLVLGIDNSDRGLWRTNAPAFHSFCEYLRAPVDNPPPSGHKAPRILAIEENVQQLKVTYKGAKTGGNSNALYLAVVELNTLVSQANSWSNIVTTPTH